MALWPVSIFIRRNRGCASARAAVFELKQGSCTGVSVSWKSGFCFVVRKDNRGSETINTYVWFLKQITQTLGAHVRSIYPPYWSIYGLSAVLREAMRC